MDKIKPKYRDIVLVGVLTTTGAGPLGAVPGAWDAGAIALVWSSMLAGIAKVSGHKLDEKFITKFCGTVASGAVGYYGGCKAATWLFHLVPGAGTLAAVGASTAMNALFTYKFGAAVSNLFDKSDFDLTDAANAATTVLALMCTFPSLDEVKDLLDLQNSVPA